MENSSGRRMAPWGTPNKLTCGVNSSRRPGYVKRPTAWAASACPRIALSSRICARWSESVKSKLRCGSRGETAGRPQSRLGQNIHTSNLLLSPSLSPQDIVFETANQRTWKVEESKFLYGLRTFGSRVLFLGGLGGEGGGNPLHIVESWKESSSSVPLEPSLNTHTLTLSEEFESGWFGPLDWETGEGEPRSCCCCWRVDLQDFGFVKIRGGGKKM